MGEIQIEQQIGLLTAMQNHNPSHREILEATDLLLRMDAVDTEILPLRSPERYGFSSGFPDLNDTWARYYPAIDLLAVQVDPWLLNKNMDPDEDVDTEDLLEELRAEGWEIDDVREITFIKKSPDSDFQNVRWHETTHVNLHRFSWWWMKIALTNCRANVLFYDVLQAFDENRDDLIDKVTDLLFFEWNSRRLLYAVLPLHESVATLMGATTAPGDTAENIDLAIEKRKQLLTLLSMERRQLVSVIGRLEKNEQKDRARRALRDVLQADEPLDCCPISLRHAFPTFSITKIQQNKRKWQLCKYYYELQILTAGKKLIEEFDNDHVVMVFIMRTAVAASNLLSDAATAPVPPSIIPPSNRFLEALDIVASHSEYYKQVITSGDSVNSQESFEKVKVRSFYEAYRLLSWLGLTPATMPSAAAPRNWQEAVQKNLSNTPLYYPTISEQLMIAESQLNPLFMLRVADEQHDIVMRGTGSQDTGYCKLNLWLTVLRWLFIESLEQQENKIDSPVLDMLRPLDTEKSMESAVEVFNKLQQNDQLDRVIEQGRDKLQSLDPPHHADPLVP